MQHRYGGPEVLALGEVDAPIPSADGLQLVGSTLYVSQNASSHISAWRIEDGTVTPLRVLADDADLDFPATIAFAGGSLWAANARFGTPPGPDVPYWLTRVETR